MLHLRHGLVAEWLGRALQKLVQQFESARDLEKRRNSLEIGSFFYAVNSWIRTGSSKGFSLHALENCIWHNLLETSKKEETP